MSTQPRPPSSPTAKATPAQVQQMGKALVGQLYMVLRTVRLHDAQNQTVLVATEHLKDSLNLCWTTMGVVKLEFVEDQVYLNDTRLRLDTQSVDNVKELANEFRSRGLGGLTFQRPVTTDGIRALMQVLAQTVGRDDPASAQELRRQLTELRDLAVEILGPRSFSDGSSAPQDLHIDPRLWALQTYAKAVLAVKRFTQEATDGRDETGGDPRLKLTRIVQDLVDIASERANLLLKMCAIKDATDYVYNHAVNVGILSIAIGRAIGLSRANLVDLGLAGMFADLGFTQGLSELLEKKELTPDDKEQMSQHTMRAVRLLIGRGALTRSSMRRIVTAFQHHVHFNLQGGYPEHERRKPLHLFARIVAIADNYDALTTIRPWREAFTPGEALQMMAAESGKKLDPVLFRVFVNLMGIHPIGMRVRLTTGETAVVYHTSDNPELFDRPYVKVTHDEHGRPLSRSLVRDLSERNPDGGFKIAIAEPIDA